MPSCKNCGNKFAASRNGATVNCPDCRKSMRERKGGGRSRSTGVYGARSCTTCDGIGMDPKAYPTKTETGGYKYPPCPTCNGTGKQSSAGPR